MTSAPIKRPGQEAGGVAPCLTGQPDANGYYTTYTSTGDYRLMTREEAIDYIADLVKGILRRDPLMDANHQVMQTVTAVAQVIVLGGTPFTHEQIMATMERKKENG